MDLNSPSDTLSYISISRLPPANFSGVRRPVRKVVMATDLTGSRSTIPHGLVFKGLEMRILATAAQVSRIRVYLEFSEYQTEVSTALSLQTRAESPRNERERGERGGGSGWLGATYATYLIRVLRLDGP